MKSISKCDIEGIRESLQAMEKQPGIFSVSMSYFRHFQQHFPVDTFPIYFVYHQNERLF